MTRRFAPHPTPFPPGVHQNRVHPLDGEKVHWTFSGSHLAPGGERDYEIGSSQKFPYVTFFASLANRTLIMINDSLVQLLLA